MCHRCFWVGSLQRQPRGRKQTTKYRCDLRCSKTRQKRGRPCRSWCSAHSTATDHVHASLSFDTFRHSSVSLAPLLESIPMTIERRFGGLCLAASFCFPCCRSLWPTRFSSHSLRGRTLHSASLSRSFLAHGSHSHSYFHGIVLVAAGSLPPSRSSSL